jgi:hypothetical protein
MDEPDPSRSRRRRQAVAPALCWIGIGLLLFARLHLLATRLYDPDEFEHLHAAVCVAGGLVPYRDFFEHHGPVTYYMSAPFVALLGPVPQLLTVNRLASLLLTVGTLAATWLISRQLYNTRVAVAALVWLSTLPPYVEKSVEWRPDVPAMFFVAWAAWLLVRPGRSIGVGAASRTASAQQTSRIHKSFGNRGPARLARPAWSVGLPAGVLLGLAAACTLKVLPVAGGMVLGALWTAPTQGRNVLRQLLAGSIGFAVVWSAIWGAFAIGAAGDDFLRCVLLYPLEWPADVPDPAARPLDHLWGIKDWSPIHLGLAVLGLGITLSRLRLRRSRRRGEPVATLGCAVHLLSLAVMPTVYLQYYLLALPLLASVSAGIACGLWESARPRFARASRRVWRAIPLAAATGTWALGTASHAPALLHAIAQGWPMHPYLVIDMASAGLALAGVWLIAFRTAVGARLLWTGLALVCVGRIAIPHFYWSGAAQRADLAVVERLVPPGQMVLDGFTGLGCLKPHALYWWWINEHSLRLMQRVGGIATVEHSIAAGEPALVIFDEHLQTLGPSLQSALLARYRPTPHRLRSSGAVLFMRNDLMP